VGTLQKLDVMRRTVVIRWWLSGRRRCRLCRVTSALCWVRRTLHTHTHTHTHTLNSTD